MSPVGLDAHGTPAANSRSAPVSTAVTPGMAAAADVSIPVMSACAYWLRTTAMCSIPGSLMSST